MKLAMTVLDRALTTKRPHLNESTVKFCDWLRKLLPDGGVVDACGNIHVDLRGDVSKTLFTAHVDTVHRKGGKNKVIKTDKKWSANGAPLGADDGAGIAILVHMIQARVPAYYVFTQGEEVGGIGAKWLAKNMPGLLSEFDRAITFDRRATYSVITHQGWIGRCASDKFGEALSEALNAQGMLFMPDNTGVYTDTAEFVEIIPECTNLSAGYDMEHSDRETLDIDHFRELCAAVLLIEWEGLPTVRDPKDVGYLWDDEPLNSWKVDDKCLEYITAQEDREFMRALSDAFDGKLNALVSMIAKAASPLSPLLAERQIDRRRITMSFLAELYDDANCVGTDTLLMTAFDEIGAGAWV